VFRAVEPPGQFSPHPILKPAALQHFGPSPERDGFRGQLQCPMAIKLAADRFEILSKDAPGNRIHHKMMRDQQKEIDRTSCLEDRGSKQRSILEVQARLQSVRPASHCFLLPGRV
jgi:hypothetical protein